ncbi:MAG: hypothetical protein ABIG42_00885 [bacterium]
MYHLLFKPALYRKCFSGFDKGAILIGLIVTMVVMSFLGAAMVSQTATSELSFFSKNSSLQAYYLAESGYRYAAAKMKHGTDMDVLHEHGVYTVGDKGGFTLEFKPYVFDVTDGIGSAELVTEVPFGNAPSLPVSSGPGNFLYLKTGSQIESFNMISIDPYPNDDIVRFVKDSGIWSGEKGERVRLVVKSNGDSLFEGGDLDLQPTSPAVAFPLHSGRIMVDNKIYQYEKREMFKLSGITMADNKAWEMPSLSDGSDIVLLDFIELHSTGTTGEGIALTSRKIVYSIPVYGTLQAEFHDPFEDKTHWEETSTLGSHTIASVNGDNVLKVESTGSVGPVEKSVIVLNPSTTNIDFSRAHLYAGNFLSYDAQVKIGFDPDIPAHYMAGILFRFNDITGYSFGVSFQKPDYHYSTSGAIDRIPDELVPTAMQNQLGIVLWQELSTGWDWLAYKKLIPIELFADDMESGTSAWSETGTWGLVAGGYNSANSWTDTPSGNYLNNSDTSITSKTLDLSGTSNVLLSFYHRYDIEPPYLFSGSLTDRGAVEISKDGGTTWTLLSVYSNWWVFVIEVNQSTWKKITISIPDSFLSNNFKVRFRLVTDSSATRDGWFIDDVKILSEHFPVNDATLLVRVRESATVVFENGILPKIEDGDILISQMNNAQGLVVGSPVVTSGSWEAGNAAGIIRLNRISNSFSNGLLKVDGKGTGLANAVGFRPKDNYIQVYFGNSEGYGNPNDNPLDYEKHANPRITSSNSTLNWPPGNAEGTTADNDYYTLVKWDEYNSMEADLFGMGFEQGTILRSSNLTTTSGTFADSEIALHTFGMDSYSTNVYFDDFGILLDIPSAVGFLPGIQE